jgi:MFS family permease
VVLFTVADTWWLVGIGTVLWAVGVSMGFPLGMSAAAESGPNSATQVSVVAAIGYAANLAGPPALGLIADHVGLLRALWVVVALLAMACLCAAAVRTTAVRTTTTIERA